jgi:hypothetical protein
LKRRMNPKSSHVPIVATMTMKIFYCYVMAVMERTIPTVLGSIVFLLATGIAKTVHSTKCSTPQCHELDRLSTTLPAVVRGDSEEELETLQRLLLLDGLEFGSRFGIDSIST